MEAITFFLACCGVSALLRGCVRLVEYIDQSNE